MVETPSSASSSSSSCASFSSFDDGSVKSSSSGNSSIKFLCSYGGKILPRYPDGKLRYFGGETRVLAVDRSVSFSELQAKMGELCGWATVSLRCQLPTEDLDALVSITSDEDLANLIEEYDLASRDRLVPLKIRAFFHESSPSKRSKSPSSPSPIPSSPSPIPSPIAALSHRRCLHQHHHHHRHQQFCSASSRFSGRCPGDTPEHHHHHHQHHGISRNQHYLVNSTRH